MHNANFRFLLNRNDFQYNYKVLWMVHFSFAQLDAKQQGWAWELASLSNNLYTSSTLTLSKVKTKNCTHCNQCVRALKQFMQTKLVKVQSVRWHKEIASKCSQVRGKAFNVSEVCFWPHLSQKRENMKHHTSCIEEPKCTFPIPGLLCLLWQS